VTPTPREPEEPERLWAGRRGRDGEPRDEPPPAGPPPDRPAAPDRRSDPAGPPIGSQDPEPSQFDVPDVPQPGGRAATLAIVAGLLILVVVGAGALLLLGGEDSPSAGTTGTTEEPKGDTRAARPSPTVPYETDRFEAAIPRGYDLVQDAVRTGDIERSVWQSAEDPSLRITIDAKRPDFDSGAARATRIRATVAATVHDYREHRFEPAALSDRRAWLLEYTHQDGRQREYLRQSCDTGVTVGVSHASPKPFSFEIRKMLRRLAGSVTIRCGTAATAPTPVDCPSMVDIGPPADNPLDATDIEVIRVGCTEAGRVIRDRAWTRRGNIGDYDCTGSVDRPPVVCRTVDGREIRFTLR
jgi:hypothetical protein